ncbi:MAG: glycine--tRNA ligase subunit beta, partial [Deltaproteobacteria bacterium]|nr:glycine--tRNA ligase subunit beta [Deltaproteobacteria bacterium]
LEIGTEEIPAAFLPKAMQDMDDMIRRELSDMRIRHGDIKTMATPRRLCLQIADVVERQEDQILEKMGPAKRAAYDEQGNPTKAALGFARGQGVDISQIETVTTEKGEYICARKKIVGEETKALLQTFFPKYISAISFKKSMRWSAFDCRFARPIHWIVALYDSEVIFFRIENVESGNKTQGHRFMSPGYFTVAKPADYVSVLRNQYVIVDSEERKKMILEETKKAASTAGGHVLSNENLLEEVTFLTEYPTAVCGSFDEDYLKLPKEVLITSMISHQKYFPVTDDAGDLLPYFITINNTLARDPDVVKKGNEKVIRARLADAKFFFDEDQKVSLDSRVDGLKQVVFHTLLGTSYDKVMRFQKLASYMADKIDPSRKGNVLRTALLAKADLDTQMVNEFTELQGVMGREYALLTGEDPVIAKAIFEHYLPVSAGGDLPETDEGAIVSIADKMDTICGFFGVGLIPTGTADPYALRRQALGIINIILKKHYPLLLDDLIDQSLTILENGNVLKKTKEETRSTVLEFFMGRFENQFIAQGYPYDVIDAVLASGLSDIAKTLKKIEALKAFKVHPDFEPLVIAFKRAGNIMKDFRDGSINPALFECDAETNLHAAYLKTSETVVKRIDGDDFAAALVASAQLRKPIDDFFESVLVMAEDERIKFNRLSLLEKINDLFKKIADFSMIVTEH